MRSFIVAVICSQFLIGANNAEADMNEAEKMMGAASIVLSIRQQQPGQVNVTSSDQASLLGYNVKFTKIRECVYRSDFTLEGRPNFTQIDFSKLSGAWRSSGREMIFSARNGSSTCFEYTYGGKGCQQDLWFPRVGNQQQLIDDVSYLLDHGCGSTNPDPY